MVTMGKKTISLTEEAYDRLARLKREDESFSELIDRIVPGTSLDDLVGILSPEEGERLSQAVEGSRRSLDDEVESTAERLDE